MGDVNFDFDVPEPGPAAAAPGVDSDSGVDFELDADSSDDGGEASVAWVHPAPAVGPDANADGDSARPASPRQTRADPSCAPPARGAAPAPKPRPKPRRGPGVKSAKAMAYVSVDSDSESDFAASSGDEYDSVSESDLEEETGVHSSRVHHEMQTGEPDVPRFAGLPLNIAGKHFPRHYGKLSIAGRLHMDIRDNEIDSLKRIPELGLSAISSGARDEYRLQYYAMYRCFIKSALAIERGRQNRAPRTLPDEAVDEMLKLYFCHPTGQI
jgi:hypothetical protein